jgi:predicted nuclease with TOPRIM domain
MSEPDPPPQTHLPGTQARTRGWHKPTRQATAGFVNPDSATFLIAALLGVGVILFLKPLGASQLVVTATVALIVLGYAFVVSIFGVVKLRLDQAGDNTYYLGLVFTLTSMARALWEVGAAAEGADGKALSVAEAIIGDFGIALTSTLVGIVGRLVLQQMRVDPADVEHVARIELATAATNMRASLNSITSDLGRWHEEIAQKHYDYTLRLIERYEATSQAAVSHANDSAHAAASSIQRTQESIVDAGEHLASSVSRLVDQLGSSADRLAEVEAPRSRLSNSFSSMASRLDKVTEHIERSDTVLVSHLETIRAAASEFGTALSAMREATQALSSATAENSARIAALEAGVSQQVEGLKSLSDALSLVVQRLDSTAGAVEERTDDVLQDLNGKVEEIGQKISSSMSAIESEVKSLSSAAESADSVARATNDAAVSVVTGLRDVVSELEHQLKTRR